MRNEPLLVQNIVMNLIEEDAWEKKLNEAESFWEEIIKRDARLSFRQDIS